MSGGRVSHAGGAVCRHACRARFLLGWFVHYTDAVAFWISENHEVGGWWAFAPVHLGRAQGKQSLDLACLIVRVQIQVNAWGQRRRRWMLVQRQIRSAAGAWT